ACFLGVPTRRTEPLPNGSNPKSRRRGRSASKPRARKPGQSTDQYCQSNEGLSYSPGCSQFQADVTPCVRALEMVRTPEGAPLPPNTLAEMRRDMARLRVVREQIREIEAARSQRLQVSESRAQAMVTLLTRLSGVGIETADMLVHEILSRQLRDRRAVARYAGLTGAPDESGK